ncbi:PadR family transcriptional regulator [Actinophytocola oryzae]|uniref:PadR family transcriptional regulator n=1 Tax=Actinophytocola oryzae TaxID=502181 RepID=UPI0010629395|nr:PadR family transcriptional regulator [Actinophytocola oryzae]
MRPDVLWGHLDGMILAVLEDEPLHGHAVMEALLSRSDGALTLSTGTLYPALRRLELAGFLVCGRDPAADRRRRTYQLTEVGRRMLADERAEWRMFAALVDRVLRPAP